MMQAFSRFMLCDAGALMLTGAAAKADGDRTFGVLARDSGANQNIKWTLIATDKITKPRKLCAMFPTMKNSYWVAGNYEMVQEAKRDGLNMQLFEAGG